MGSIPTSGKGEIYMEKEINIPFKLFAIRCKECEVTYSVIAHQENGDYWPNQDPPYCPYCMKAIRPKGESP